MTATTPPSGGEFGDKAYQQLFHHNAAVMLLIDPANGEIINANESALRFYGYPRAHLLRLRIWELNQLPEGDVRRAMQSIPDAVGQRFEFSHRLADGSVREVEVFSCVVNTGKRKLLHSIVSDITERKRTEAALQISEERYRAVVEDQTEVISRIKRTGEFTFVNEVFCRFFGKTSDELIGRHWSPRAVAEDLPLIEAKLRTLSRANPVVVTENRVYDGKGEVCWMQFVNRAFFDAQGEHTETQSVGRDITKRKLAEAALLRSHARFHQLLETATDGIHIIDATGQLVEASTSFYRQLGYVAGEKPALKLSDWDAHWSADELQEKLNLLLASESVFETIHRRRDGTLIEVEVNARGIKIAGEPFVYAAARDITERKRAATAIREAKEAYDQLVRLIPDGICVFRAHADGRWQMEYASPKAAELFGVDADVMLADVRSATRYAHPEDEPGIWEELRRTIAVRSMFYCEARFRRDGKERWLRMNGEPTFHGNGDIVWNGVVSDVTERKQAERELERSARQIEDLYQNAPCGYHSVDASGLIVEMNDQELQWFGYQREEIVSKRRITEFMTAESQQSFARHFPIFLQSGVVRDLPLDFRRKDGSVLPALVSATAVRDDAGQFVMSRSTVFDMTERNQLEARVRQSQKMETVGRLAGGVAHEFNNLLAAMMMNLELMKQCAHDVDIREGITELSGLAQRAADLVRQLLALGRKTVLRPTRLDVRDWLGQKMKMLQQLFGERIALRLAAKDGDFWIEADEGALTQVLLNVCLNARDAMPQGGTINIELSSRQVCDETMHQRAKAENGKYVCLAISDTGCGMSSATLKRLFEPFFTTKDVGQGSGLGLATALGLVEQQRGWIEVESELERGTVVRVMWPVAAEPAASPERAAKRTAPTGRGTILLVEDEARLRRSLARLLQAQGYSILEATNAVEAITLWQGNRSQIDLLFTDMVMPGVLSGLDLARKLVREKPNLKVILTSGYSERLPAEEEQESFSFLPKPSDPAELLTLVARLFGAPD